MQQIATNIHVSAIKSIHSIRVVTLFTSEVVGSKQSNQICRGGKTPAVTLLMKKQQVGIPDTFEWPIESVSEGENYCWKFAQEDLTGVIGISSDVRHLPVEGTNHHLHSPVEEQNHSLQNIIKCAFLLFSSLRRTRWETCRAKKHFAFIGEIMWAMTSKCARR